MKKLVLILIAFFIGLSVYSQSKEEKQEYKEFTKVQMNEFNHKQFWKNNEPWTFAKIAIHFKEVTSDGTVAVNTDVSATSNLRTAEAKSWAILKGVSESTFQEITDEFTTMLKDRIKKELGIDIYTWNKIKDSENVKKIMIKEKEKQVFNKNEGFAQTKTADNGPFYTHVIVMVPDGKKLSKETGGKMAELDIVLDFAMFEMALKAYQSGKSTSYSTGMGGSQIKTTTNYYKSESSGNIYPIIHCATNFDSSMGEGSLITTKFYAQDKNLYNSTEVLLNPVFSTTQYATKIKSSNKLSDEILNRYKVKWEDGWNKIYMYEVETTDEMYKAAALNALSNYLDQLLYVFKYNQAASN